MSNEPKQVIVVRTDINMSVGKTSAQVAHASMKVFFDRSTIQRNIWYSGEDNDVEYAKMVVNRITIPEMQWLEGEVTKKIIVSVESLNELMNIYLAAVDRGLPCALIEDLGKTEFKEPTITCCSIGPALPEDLDPITGDLKLL